VSHPEELLADYVDGTLDLRGRAAVDSHLLGCERCREELREAQEAKAALVQLEDRPVPFGVTGPVLAEAGRRFERRRGIAWERFQWAAGLAAAAALVVVVALNVGDGGPQDAAAPASTGATGATGSTEAAELAAPSRPSVGLERQERVDYDPDGIRAVAVEAADALVSDQAGQGAGASASGAADSERRTSAAKGCVKQSGLQGPGDELVRLIEAEFEGTPAYIAVFAQGPGAGQPPDHVVVVVVATDDCRLLTSADLRVPPA
jgi:hypothetical protein